MISSHDLQILSSTSLFAGFSEDALRALCAALRPSVAELPRGRVLWRMGEQVTQAGIVLSGRVEAWHYTAAGQADLAAVHGVGGVFGDVLMSAQTVGSPVSSRTICAACFSSTPPLRMPYTSQTAQPSTSENHSFACARKKSQSGCCSIWPVMVVRQGR